MFELNRADPSQAENPSARAMAQASLNRTHYYYLATKGGSDLVWYFIDRDIFKTESIFCRKKQINPVGSGIGLPRSLLTINT